MFASNSRYARVPVVQVELAPGTTVNAVKLRRLPYVPGHLTEAKGTDRLDLMAYRRYQDGTWFWHIADANTALEANDLLETPRRDNPVVDQPVPTLLVPGS